MKQFIFCMALLVVTVTAGAQKIASAKVPAPVREAFAKAHPDATAQWEKEDGNYEAGFKENGKPASCLIDAKGAILETETTIAVSELPAAVANYVRAQYKNASIKEASRIVDSKGAVTYEAVVNKKDLLFDSQGRFLKTVAD